MCSLTDGVDMHALNSAHVGLFWSVKKKREEKVFPH